MESFNKIRTYLFLLLSVIFFFIACDSKDDNPPLAEYAVGIVISNEGSFMNSNASISFYNRELNEAENGVFEKVNGRPLGDVLQSVSFHNGRGYLVVNNSNKIEVIEDGTFKSLGIIEEGLASPRYFAAFENKGFVTNWGNFDENFQLDQSYIAVIDLNTMEVTKKINTDNGTERIVIAGNKIYATNSFTNTLSIINLSTEEEEDTIELSSSPNGISVDIQGHIWVLCKGTFEGNNGKLFSIDPNQNTIIKEIELNRNTAGHLVTNTGGNRLFYTSGKSIYEILYTADAAPGTALVTNDDMDGNFYGLGTDPLTDIIYASDDVGFRGNGRVYRYDMEGIPIDDFEVGIGPNGFWFK